jgi:hypothetical protein
VARAARESGFGWVALNGSAVHIAGAHHAAALSEDLEKIHDRIRAEVGHD